MKTQFVTGILFALLVVAAPLASAAPRPQDAPAVAAETPAVVAESPAVTAESDATTSEAPTALKQNIITDTLQGFNNFIGSISSLGNIFSAPAPSDAAAPAPAATGPNVLEGIANAFNPVGNFINEQWTNLSNAIAPTTPPVKNADSTTAAPATPVSPAAAAPVVADASLPADNV